MKPVISPGFWVAAETVGDSQKLVVVEVKGDLVFYPGNDWLFRTKDFLFIRKIELEAADEQWAARVVTVQFTVTAPSKAAAEQAVIQSLRDPQETGHRPIDSWEIV